CCNNSVPVAVGGPLLELCDILPRAHGPLGSKQTLDVDAAERRSVDPPTEFLRPNVAHEVRGRIRVPVRVTVKTNNPLTGTLGAPIAGRVELLLGKRGHEQAKPLELLGVEDAVE